MHDVMGSDVSSDEGLHRMVKGMSWRRNLTSAMMIWKTSWGSIVSEDRGIISEMGTLSNQVERCDSNVQNRLFQHQIEAIVL
ncbi:hypothetical protein Tco_0882327 [Tanacetum coccineum]